MVSDFHNSKPFLWHSFSLNEYLIKIAGDGWAKEIIEFAKSSLKLTPIVPRSVTSREADRDSVIQAAVVDGRKIKEGLP